MNMHRENCDRCGKPTESVTTMSWFTEEIICMICSDNESTVKGELRKQGQSTMEGCGYVPVIRKPGEGDV